MTKRFKIVDEQFISYYGGTGHKISNGECGFWLWHNKIESQKVCDKLNSILEENEQLKKRNTNQYNQLDQLWELIQAKDWETLTEMDNQMKEDDKRLRNEWRCYE